MRRFPYWGLLPGEEELSRAPKTRRQIRRDNLEGGIAYFINDSDSKKKSNSFSKRKIESRNNGIKTERVINPSLNNEYYEEINGHIKNYLKRSSSGNFSSLLMKTPMTYFPPGRKKRVASSIDRKQEKHIFSKDFLMDNKDYGLFEVERKARRNTTVVSNVNSEKSDLSNEKRHFDNKK